MTADSLGEVCGSLRPLLVQHLARQALAVQHSNRHDELNRILADMPPPMGPLNRLDRIDDDTVLLYGRALGSSADVPRTLHLSSANPIPAQLPFGPAGVDLFLSHIQYLNLHGQALKRIEGLRSLTSLHTLILSFNELTKIEGIAGMRTLRRYHLIFQFFCSCRCQPLMSEFLFCFAVSSWATTQSLASRACTVWKRWSTSGCRTTCCIVSKMSTFCSNACRC
jgi:hypothetical protein